MIEFKSLEKTPECARDKTHHYCDYIELITLCSDEDGISSFDIYDRFQEDGRISSIGTEDGAESNESWVAEIGNWFVELEVRSRSYGNCYPFEFKNSRFVLRADLDDYHLMYLGLLLCSSLRYISNSSVLSSAFEYASLCAMERYLPEVAEVHIFGVSSGNSGKYVGSLENKIRLLSDDIKYPISSRPNVFRAGDNGDGGIDIIAWVPFLDDVNLDKKLFFVGQSAATMEWAKKQHSVERVKSYLDIEHTLLNCLYVPFDMRDNDRNICEWTIVTTDVLFDRHRMLKLIKPVELFSGSLGGNFKDLILSAVDFEESYF